MPLLGYQDCRCFKIRPRKIQIRILLENKSNLSLTLEFGNQNRFHHFGVNCAIFKESLHRSGIHVFTGLNERNWRNWSPKINASGQWCSDFFAGTISGSMLASGRCINPISKAQIVPSNQPFLNDLWKRSSLGITSHKPATNQPPNHEYWCHRNTLLKSTLDIIQATPTSCKHDWTCLLWGSEGRPQLFAHVDSI